MSVNSSAPGGEVAYHWSELRYPPAVTALLCLAYLVVFLVGVSGNVLVVMVVCRSPRMRSPTNLFIANLACADLLVNVLCLPFTLVSNVMAAWTMGWLACKTVPYLQGVSVNASINTLVAISVERCAAICCPMRWRVTSSCARAVILVIWLTSFTLTLPWALFFQLQPLYKGSDVQTCLEMWPTKYSGNVYFIVANLVMCYLLPLALITCCYLLIWRRVLTRRPPGVAQPHADRIVHNSKVKVVKMLMTVIILFAFSWLPLYLIFARIKLGGPIGEEEEALIFVLLPFGQWLGTSNSCINPVLYAYFNRKFRAGFKAIAYSRSCCATLYYAPSGSDLRTASSRQTLYCQSSVDRFQGRKTKSCSLLFSNSNNSLNKIRPLALPKFAVSFRSISADNIYKSGKKYRDTRL